MLERCYNPDFVHYRDYGGRDITVCEQWRTSVGTFIADMGPRPTPQHTLDRIDNNGPYCPNNCRWATKKEQTRNKRNNRMLTYRGETLCLSEWAERLGISANALYMRLYNGWSTEEALSTKGKVHRWHRQGPPAS